MSNELLPCPCCNGKAIICKPLAEITGWVIRCSSTLCLEMGLAAGQDSSEDLLKLIAAWNCRFVKQCKWTLVDEDCACYETDCGEVFELNAGTPKENKIGFCCYCGGELIEEDHDLGTINTGHDARSINTLQGDSYGNSTEGKKENRRTVGLD